MKSLCKDEKIAALEQEVLILNKKLGLLKEVMGKKYDGVVILLPCRN